MQSLQPKMNAVRYLGAEKNFEMKTVPIPTFAEAGQVIIEIKAASLCHTELHFADGTLNLGVNDITMGHECAGIIVSVGQGVLPTRVGERVIVYYYAGCGKCRYCLAGNEQLCNSLSAQYGFISDGSLAHYITVYSRNAVILPDSINFVDAAPIACSVTTAVHAMKLARPVRDEWVLIFGVNGVGFNCIQLAKHLGLKVIAVCRSAEKRSKSLQLGADVVVDASNIEMVSESVHKITGDCGVDIIFDCVGSKETMGQCLGWTGALGKRGRMIFIGYQKGDEHAIHIHPIPLIVKEQQIIGSVGATLQDLEEAIKYVEDGIITTVIDSCISLSAFQYGLDRMKLCKCIGKIVIDDFSG